MKKLLVIASLLLVQGFTAQQLVPERPFIEVNGASETEIEPDIIDVTITLGEYESGKGKTDIAKQEENLKKALKDLGIDLKQLTLVTAVADYHRIHLMKKDVVNTRTYLLRLSSAEMVGKVYEQLDKLDVSNAYVSRLDHTKILEYQKENRIKAIRAAQEKANYLMAALGKTAGSPLQVTEGENWVDQGNRSPYLEIAAKSANSLSESYSEESSPIGMRKIKLRSGYLVKFEIK